MEETKQGAELTPQQISEAATNNPALSPDEFKLGETTFKIVHLPYDDYVSFIAYLQPFLDAITSKMADKVKISVPGLDIGKAIDGTLLIKFCGTSLPEMARLICKQTYPNITVDQIKKDAGTPFILANIVLQQVIKNGMLRDFASFFAQIAPLFKSLR